jgi:hypothetical protein
MITVTSATRERRPRDRKRRRIVLRIGGHVYHVSRQEALVLAGRCTRLALADLDAERRPIEASAKRQRAAWAGVYHAEAGRRRQPDQAPEGGTFGSLGQTAPAGSRRGIPR